MARIGVLQHFWCETPGILSEALREAGHELVTVLLYAGEPVPARDAFNAWLVMGGPMNVDELDKHAFLGPERGLLAALIADDAPVMGICLGAQLLARAAGARVYAKRPKEIGLFEITPTAAAATDPLMSLCRNPQEVFQWHGDTFDLPPGAVHLARSARFEHQAFRLGRRVYGIQFHLECTYAMVRDLLRECAGDLASLAPEDRFEQYAGRLEGALASQNVLARVVIGRWVELIGAA